jgi:excisionase family DNA binding protein
MVNHDDTQVRKWLTVGEVAFFLGVHAETVRRWVRSGKMESRKLGSTSRAQYRISEESLHNFIEQGS